MHNSDARLATKQNDQMLRTSESLKTDLEKNDPKSTGVKFNSVLTE